MSQKDDRIELLPPEGVSGGDLQDPPSQYEAGGYTAPNSAQSEAAQPATWSGFAAGPAESYGRVQPASGHTQLAIESGKPAESYGYDQPNGNQLAPAFRYNQPATRHTQPAEGYNNPAESYGYHQPALRPTQQPVVQQPARRQQQTTVNMSVSSPTVVVQHPPEKPPDYMWLSCLVYWFCNCVVGLIAFAFSSVSSDLADQGHMADARTYGKRALYTSLIGVPVGIICIVLLVLYTQGVIASTDSNDLYYDSHDGYHSTYG